jgi:protein gp37
MKLYWKTLGQLRLDGKCFKDNLGHDNMIFVGSSTDMWADSVPSEWINRVLDYCKRFPNTYLFQSKNPKRFINFSGRFPPNTILGTTLETNKQDLIQSKAPTIKERVEAMQSIGFTYKMISLEPMIDFDLEEFVQLIKSTNPIMVSIGADSKHSGLVEPSREKIDLLIKRLSEFTEVKVKDNLGRIV